MKALLLDDQPDEHLAYQASLRTYLMEAGYPQLVCTDDIKLLIKNIKKEKPNLIIMILKCPDQGILEILRHIDRDMPTPVVLLAKHSSHEITRAAIEAGVSAYIVDDWPGKRIKSVLDVAYARFQVRHHLKSEVAGYKLRLEDRKDVEKAKGALMNHLQVDEDEAYQLLRKMAMDHNLRMGDAARNLISSMALLEKRS